MRCESCAGTGHPDGNLWLDADCRHCDGRGFLAPEPPCCSRCGEDSDDLTQTSEDNGGMPWVLCPDCLGACDGCGGSGAERKVDGDRFCDLCVARLVLLSMRLPAPSDRPGGAS